MRLLERIESNPRIMLGKPVIRGTRIPVEIILRRLAEGASERSLMVSYPRLTPADIRAAMHFAAATVAREETLALSVPKRSARA